MTAHTTEKSAVPHPETGWSKAHRRDKGPRTCLPAIAERAASPDGCTDRDGNIVRGED
ncbi:hypothetical protein [Streptomyces sp. NPDC047028]|uniref:hypothetical protein n=1 Tax=Streptomyces sp. NPDC047028 TaxID=3155793 RepID=UPI0033C20585